MGTISEKLDYLEETKEAIGDAIAAKGISVSSTDTFRSYAEKIALIEGEGGVSSVDLSNYVTLDGTQTITGTKTFSATPVVTSAPTSDTQAANKSYVDTQVGTVATDVATVEADLESFKTSVESDLSAMDTDIQSRQPMLVDGSNIKLINGESVLGSGNLTVPAIIDGTNLIGFYGEADWQRDMTSTYGLQPSDVAAVYAGATIEWTSTLMSNVTHSAVVLGTSTSRGTDSTYGSYTSKTFYLTDHITSLEFEYVYTEDTVYKGELPSSSVGVACFTGDTLVATPTGFKAIGEIKVGDVVLTNSNGAETPIEVLRTVEHEDYVYSLSIGDDVIRATGSHPFNVDGAEVEAKDLKVGDIVNAAEGVQYTIDSIRKDRKETVYEIVVPTYNYFVGLNKIAVFNEKSVR